MQKVKMKWEGVSTEQGEFRRSEKASLKKFWLFFFPVIPSKFLK